MSFPPPLPTPQVVDKVELQLDFKVSGKARPRMGTNKHTGKACVFMNKNYVLNKASVSWAMRNAIMAKPGFMSPDAMYVSQIILYRKRRKTTTRLQRALWPFGGLAKGKPDIDNAVGTLFDAANKILYGDDDQVVSTLVERRWAKEDGAYLRFLKLADYEQDPSYDYEE